MSTATTTKRTVYRGTEEYVSVQVTADEQLGSQTVKFSFDRSNWHAAEWVGSAGVVRQARLLVGSDAVPLPETDNCPLYVQVTDNPEVPVIRAGTLVIL